MSWQATAFVKSLRISPTGHTINRGEKLILFLLADYTDPHTCTAWPSVDALAEDGLYERRQVTRILNSLESKGFITTLHSPGRAVNRYMIVGVTRTKCPSSKSKSKPANKDISESNKDILSTNKDIAMSYEPQEPIQQPQLTHIVRTSKFFDKAYEQYPRHVGRPAAEKAWNKIGYRLNKLAALEDSPLKGIGDKAEEFIYQRVMTYAAVCKRIHKDKQFIPHMATWLNQDRFMDDPTEWAVDNGQQTTKAERRNADISETTRRVFDPARHIPGYVAKGLPDKTSE